MAKNKIKKKFKFWEIIFISLSAFLILSFTVFYGLRLIKYYKIYNLKLDSTTSELVKDAIVKNTQIVYEQDGLYRQAGLYVYKGESVNNYIMYSNMLFRIIKFNVDGSLDLVLENNINALKWDDTIKDFNKSDLYDYLNTYLYNLLDKELLSNTSICLDPVNDLENITCQNKDTNGYVRLLSINEYLNSKSSDTYINDDNSIWLSNRSNLEVWNINDSNLSISKPDNIYYVKPVITIKNSARLLSGTGTKEDPYIISKKEGLEVGKYVKLGSDTYVIYNKDNDNFLLALNSSNISKSFNLNSTSFNTSDTNSIAYYLNNEYYNSLSYKDKLISTNWYIGEYKTYKSILDNSVSSFVGLLNISDLKLVETDDFYLLTKSKDDRVYVYSPTILDSNPNMYHYIVPTISINNLNILSGSGTKDNPYVLEV